MRDRHREGAGFERQALRGCRRRETDTCVLSGREGAGLERQTQRGCRFGDRYREGAGLERQTQRGYRFGETDTERVQVWRDRQREGAGLERQTRLCCQAERVQARRDRHLLSGREGADLVRLTQRGCRLGETDTSVLSGREGAGEERQTLVCCQGQRVQIW